MYKTSNDKKIQKNSKKVLTMGIPHAIIIKRVAE